MHSIGFNDFYLQPGGIRFGASGTRIHTLLGSCVAIVLWHPQRRLGGMCHFMLPRRRRDSSMALDGRYADEALALMLNEIDAMRIPLAEFRVSVYGGGNMFPNIGAPNRVHVGRQNALAAQQLLALYGLTCHESQVEGIGHRKLSFDIASGNVSHRHSTSTCDQHLKPLAKTAIAAV